MGTLFLSHSHMLGEPSGPSGGRPFFMRATVLKERLFALQASVWNAFLFPSRTL